MAWRDRLLPASFRGVPFNVEEASREGGRRTAVHEYPNRDTPFTEDMGRKARSFTISAYVIGDDYMAGRDALLDALEKPGVGELIHPYLGSLTAALIGYTSREGADEGRMARFQLTFTESGEQIFPSASRDGVQTVGAAADLLSSSVQNRFASVLRVVDVPEFVRQAGKDEVGNVTGILGLLSFPGAEPDVLSQYTSLVSSVSGNIDTLINSPGNLAAQLSAAVAAVRSLFVRDDLGAAVQASDAALASVNLAKVMQASPTQQEPTSTPSRIAAGDNRQAVYDLVQGVAVAENAKALVVRDFPSYEQAVAARDSILDDIDARAERAGDDEFVALQNLRAAVVDAVPSPTEDLPRLTTVRLPSSIPSILLAYELYDNAARNDEIVLRNRVPHPAFLPSNRDLQVLTDE